LFSKVVTSSDDVMPDSKDVMADLVTAWTSKFEIKLSLVVRIRSKRKNVFPNHVILTNINILTIEIT
jgi:hypothetical protein